MKTGLTTSVVLHAALLGFGLFSLSAPKAYEVMDVESLPVDIVPVESITQIQQGDKKAPADEKPAPVPTKRPDIVPDAQKVGENSVDTDKPVTPEAKPKPVDAAAIPEPSPKPEPKPVKEAEPAPAPPPEPKPVVPATEVTPQPTPKEEVKPDPVEQAIAAAEPVPDAEAIKLPDQAPAPEAKPQPAKAETAKTPDRKDADKPVKEAAAKPKSEEKKFDADQVAMLLNKEKASGGGAKRSTQQAALGGDKTTGAKLSQGEMDALSNQLGGCWSIPAGLADGAGLRVSVRFNLDGSGKLEGRPTVDASSGNRTFDESAVRAVQKCDRDGLQLPKDKAETWAEVVVNFDPSEMF